MQGVGCRVATQRAEGLSAKRQSGGVRFAPSAAAGARRSAGDAPSTSGRPPVAWSHTSRSLRCQAAAATAESNGNGAVAVKPTSGVDKLRVIIAGGGIGGLLLAAGLLKRGYDVVVLERDLTSIKVRAVWLSYICARGMLVVVAMLLLLLLAAGLSQQDQQGG